MSIGTVQQPDTVKIGAPRPQEPPEAVERCIEGALVGDLYRIAKKIEEIAPRKTRREGR